jgi:Tol biopolymer transport system component
LRLTTDPAADTSPAWLPDGSAVAFTSLRNGRPGIWKVPRLGGSTVLVVDDAEQPAIAPDGRRVAFARKSDSGYKRIAVASLASPGPASVLTRDGDGLWDHEEPAWSPDGATICYRDWRDLWLVPADGGRARRLTADDPTDQEPTWSPDGSWIYFSSMRRGTTALWRIRPSGPGLQRVMLGAGPERHPALASRPPRVAYSTHVDDSDIVVLDRRTGGQSRIAGSRTDATPDLAPDGRAVVFSSDRRGKFDLWLQRLEQGRPQGEPVQLTDHAGSAACGRFSPDGRWIAYFRVDAGEREIWIVPAAGGIPVRLTDRAGADVQPSFSPDGLRLVFVSDRGGGMNLWAAALLDGPALGEARQLTRGPGPDGSPVWSPDGRRLLFRSRGDLWLLTLASGKAEQVTDDVAVALATWEPEGDAALVLGSWDGQPAEVRRVGLDPHASGGAGEVVVPASLGRLGYLGASRDGRLVAVVVEATGGDVWVLEPES